MARQETVAFIDDIDGVSYGIDLHNKNAAALQKSLAEFVAGARQVHSANLFAAPGPRRRQVRKRAAGEPAAAEIRAWAATAGVAMSTKGRISATVLEQYLAAGHTD